MEFEPTTPTGLPASDEPRLRARYSDAPGGLRVTCANVLTLESLSLPTAAPHCVGHPFR